MFCNEISWHDLLIRQASGKFADCAAQFANWLANLPIGRSADWTEHTGIFQGNMRLNMWKYDFQSLARWVHWCWAWPSMRSTRLRNSIQIFLTRFSQHFARMRFYFLRRSTWPFIWQLTNELTGLCLQQFHGPFSKFVNGDTTKINFAHADLEQQCEIYASP